MAKDNNVEMYSIHNEGKSIVAERFIRTLKTKIYKYMLSISKNVYIAKLDNIVNEYNNTYDGRKNTSREGEVEQICQLLRSIIFRNNNILQGIPLGPEALLEFREDKMLAISSLSVGCRNVVLPV